jgi:hypothetical protein
VRERSHVDSILLPIATAQTIAGPHTTVGMFGKARSRRLIARAPVEYFVTVLRGVFRLDQTCAMYFPKLLGRFSPRSGQREEKRRDHVNEILTSKHIVEWSIIQPYINFNS